MQVNDVRTVRRSNSCNAIGAESFPYLRLSQTSQTERSRLKLLCGSIAFVASASNSCFENILVATRVVFDHKIRARFLRVNMQRKWADVSFT